MHINNTHQKHSYREFIENFSLLFEEIKDKNPLSNEIRKEDESVYNAVVGFNTVKFLTRHTNWNWDEDKNKNKAYKVIPSEWNKIKKTEQKFESEVKARLKEYVDDITGVSIYGDHASITLEDGKKEFKISEFLNSDFCQKKGISGFSMLHSDGKSGMHGFVAGEGGKKIRHYVVTDGSYEMTLNWHDKNGKKCTIKIKIDKDGVDLVERNGVTEEQLKANTDVKIGGLFLHEIKFREKGRGQENAQSSETFIENNSGKNIDTQAHRTLRSNSSYDSGIEEDLDDAQKTKEEHKPRQAAQEKNSDAHIYNFQSPLAENLQSKKRTPPPPPLRTSSLKKDISFDGQGAATPESQRPDKIPNNQQKSEYKPIKNIGAQASYRSLSNSSYDSETEEGFYIGNNSKNVDVQRPHLISFDSSDDSEIEENFYKRKPISRWGERKESLENFQLPFVENSQNKRTPPPPLRTSSLPNNQQKDEYQSIRINSGNNYNSPSSDSSNSTAFTKSVSQKVDRNEQENLTSGNQQQEGNSNNNLLQGIINARKNLQHIGIDGREASIEKSKENNLSKKLMDKIPYSPSSNIHEHNSDNQDAEWEESEQQFPVLIPKSTNGSSYSSPEAPEEHGKNSKSETHKTPITNPVDQVWLKDKIEGKEDNRIISTEKNIDVAGLLKDNAAEREINDSGYSSPTYTSHYNFQVNPEQLEKRLETIEPKDTLERLNKGLREPSHQATKDLFSENMLEKIKEGEKYDPVRKLLERKVAEQENDNTNLTIDKNSELYKLLEKDAAQLKAGIIEEERKDTLIEHNDSPDRNRVALANKNKKLLWTKRIAEQQEKDDGISI